MLTFGIEEEFVLLDRATLVPVPIAADIQRGLATFGFGPDIVHSEFLRCQVEYCSPVLMQFDEAAQALWDFRSVLAACAEEYGAVVAGVGTSFMNPVRPMVTENSRYREIAECIGLLASEHYINGLHIHVGVPSREAGIVSLNFLRRWLPTVLAMSANSPYWCGQDTWFSSWRAIQYRRWSTAGCPPEFVDATDYDQRIQALIGMGITPDEGSISWSARLSARHPTVEVRVADAQLNPSTTLLLALLIRAIVLTSMAHPGTVKPGQDPELLDAALWHAARYGLSAQLVHPLHHSLMPASEAVQSLLDTMQQALEVSGDLAIVTALTEQLLLVGTGADRQRLAFNTAGQKGLASFLAKAVRSESSAHLPVTGHLGPNDPRPMESDSLS
ncbi:glutamate--cysteine ligase [Arthrobacter sp. BF1]|uniref:carboxylate-amine ligase n=1 Tax=Arthrobacter sp. BF1 TaxID=2821145 RepID=UPI00211A7C68|nr:glutamate--cysteine ligase [Arthrobacter sp. BF1]